ncbi:MAG: DUF3408 domain-containing protein [Alistipes sp.]|jgi:hypothetical protein|uniref:DUF3408 domain-containing protein n=1 Tax=uncultured Alistipes sp. TaxID=538949 RepID=UPI0025930263|nr:DUF3408 domain-containing protein [uncultured Alistipes sp.]MCI9244166.1 DUF3408 domain-containing protein [Alistipes sp.]
MSENIIVIATVATTAALVAAPFIFRVLHYHRRVQSAYPAIEPIEEKSIQTISADTTSCSVSTKDDARRRKGRGHDYETLFIRNAPSNTRSGKTVYIRREFHERITRIVQVIGKNEVSLYSYLDNVLEHHFAAYQEEISELYKKRNDDIF